ncbi:hypothetical protein AB1L07_02630 [Niallia alba]|uniref:hypothetical protein n=1 Tax=Niallia alba TaxID=2729105 RepID=UPI0039A266B9
MTSQILMVFETDLDEKGFVLNNKIHENTHTASVQRGAGSIPLKDKNIVFDTVIFIKTSFYNGNYGDYAYDLDKFINDLFSYDVVDIQTTFI